MDWNQHQICTSNRKPFYKVTEIHHRKEIGQQLFGCLHIHNACLADGLLYSGLILHRVSEHRVLLCQERENLFFLMGNVSNKDSPEMFFQEACIHIWVQRLGRRKVWVSSCPPQLSATWRLSDLLPSLQQSSRQLKSACFHRGVRSRWHCCFSTPASVSFCPL